MIDRNRAETAGFEIARSAHAGRFFLLKAGAVGSPDIISPLFHITRCLAADAFCNVAGSKAAEKGTGEARWLAMAASASNAVRKIDIEALIR